MHPNKIRWLACACVLLAAAHCAALSMVSEAVGQNMWFTFLVPYGELQFETAEDGNWSCHSELGIDVADGRGHELFHKLHSIAFGMPANKLPGGTLLPVVVHMPLHEGYYTVHASLFNKLTGAKITKTFDGSMPVGGQQAGRLWASFWLGEAQFVPQAPWPAGIIDSVRFCQAFAEQPDSVMLHAGTLGELPMRPRDGLWCAGLPRQTQPWDIDNSYTSAWYGGAETRTDFAFTSLAMLALSQYTPQEQLAQLRYILNSNELRAFQHVKDDDLQAALDRFWEANDPSPGTRQNEYRNAFYQRIAIADERYTIKGGRSGWRTDRGRIYILYGDPDEVVEDVHPIETRPYIIWRYYNEMKEFTFYDFKGFGDYELRNKWQD